MNYKYLFSPSLKQIDHDALARYNLKYIKENHSGTVVPGTLNDLSAFALRQRGEEINERYLMEETR